MNASKLAVPALCVGLLGVVGGVAAAQAFKPADKPQQVRLVQPAAETVTPTVEVTVTPSVASTTVAPKPVKSVKVAVPLKPKATTTSVAPRTVQRQAVVSQDPTPVDTTPPAPASPLAPRPLKPAIEPGQPTSGGGVYGGGASTPPPAKP